MPFRPLTPGHPQAFHDQRGEHRVKLPLALIAAAVAVAAITRLSAHATTQDDPFPPPDVRVVLSERVAGGHPDQQTIIDVPIGLGFDQLRLLAPAGSTIAADGDIPDGTPVGRLDAVATTNAIVRPDCDVTVGYTVPIVEATTDITAPDYPAYLRRLAPGAHRIRFVADVSPSPELPILINYLVDFNRIAQSLVTQVFVGDPDNPVPGFRACAPQSSRNTIFGITPDGTPLLTAADPLPDDPQPFRFTFTSRPDADGTRYTRDVEAFAEFSPAGVERVGAPIPQPQDLRLTLLGSSGRLDWQYDAPADQFEVSVTFTQADGQRYTESRGIGGDARSFELDPWFVPRCGDPVITYGVQAQYLGRLSLVEGIGPFDGCARAADLALPPPSNMQLTQATDGGGEYLHWSYDLALAQSFYVQVVIEQPGVTLTETYGTLGSTTVRLDVRHVAVCGDTTRRATYRVAALIDSRVASPFAELPSELTGRGCLSQSLLNWRSGITPPEAGDGPPAVRGRAGRLMLLLAAGALACIAGLLLRRRDV
jgi:hypothetical protein